MLDASFMMSVARMPELHLQNVEEAADTEPGQEYCRHS